jgi:hypothetical protein
MNAIRAFLLRVAIARAERKAAAMLHGIEWYRGRYLRITKRRYQLSLKLYALEEGQP